MQTKNINDIFSNDVRSFSIYDCQRSLPSGIDGMKPSMRKIMFGMVKKFPNQEIKVSLAAAGIQECLTDDTLIRMKDGTLKSIKSIIESNGFDVPFDVVSVNVSDMTVEDDRAIVIDRGETTELYEITLFSGEVVRCTSEHRFYTTRGWVFAKDLLDDDEIVSI